MVQRIREAGHGATQLKAEGQSGQVHLISVVTSRKHLADILKLVNQVDADSFVTIDETSQVVRGYQRITK